MNRLHVGIVALSLTLVSGAARAEEDSHLTELKLDLRTAVREDVISADGKNAYVGTSRVTDKDLSWLFAQHKGALVKIGGVPGEGSEIDQVHVALRKPATIDGTTLPAGTFVTVNVGSDASKIEIIAPRKSESQTARRGTVPADVLFESPAATSFTLLQFLGYRKSDDDGWTLEVDQFGHGRFSRFGREKTFTVPTAEVSKLDGLVRTANTHSIPSGLTIVSQPAPASTEVRYELMTTTANAKDDVTAVLGHYIDAASGVDYTPRLGGLYSELAGIAQPFLEDPANARPITGVIGNGTIGVTGAGAVTIGETKIMAAPNYAYDDAFKKYAGRTAVANVIRNPDQSFELVSLRTIAPAKVLDKSEGGVEKGTIPAGATIHLRREGDSILGTYLLVSYTNASGAIDGGFIPVSAVFAGPGTPTTGIIDRLR
jgi:hypothetical protein